MSKDLDVSKRSRRGPEPLSNDAKRNHCVSVRLNDAELAQLERQRLAPKMQRGEYLRVAALHELPPTIPALNRSAYAALARVGANINQIAKRLNADQMASIDVELIRAEMAALRLAMIGANPSSSDDDDG